MKAWLLLLLFCISFLKYTSAQLLLNDSGSMKIEQDPANKNMFVVKIFNFNGSPDEYWSMFSSVDTLNDRNYNRLLSQRKVFPEGKHSMYYPDSKLKFEENYHMKAKTGEIKGYYNNGVVKFAGTLNEKSTGKVTQFYPNGSIRKLGKLLNLLPEGKVTEYYQDGNILSVTHYLNGKKDGKYTSYYPDAKKKREIIYTGGIVESEKCFDQSGKNIKRLF